MREPVRSRVTQGPDASLRASRTDWLGNTVILVVLLVWAVGAVADLAQASYSEPEWIHVIAFYSRDVCCWRTLRAAGAAEHATDQ